jgi:hypothetical protein
MNDPNNPHSSQAPTRTGDTSGTAAGFAISDEKLVGGGPDEKKAATTPNVSSDETAPANTMTGDDAKASPPGAFAPLRHYINQRLRNGPDITTPHGNAGEEWKVTELTFDGLLRLANPHGDDFTLVPLDERYIPSLFSQII